MHDVQREGEIGSIDTQPPGEAEVRTPNKPLENQNERMVEDDVPISPCDKNKNQSGRTVRNDSPNRKRTHSPEDTLPRRTRRKVVR